MTTIAHAKFRRPIRACALMTVVLSLSGCSTPHRTQTKLIPHYQIGDSVQIVGALGYPLGTYLVVRGSWINEKVPPKSPLAPWSFNITHVNGDPVKRAVRFYSLNDASSEQVAEKVPGKIWELRGFESGGFEGMPAEVIREMFKVLPPFQYQFGFKFETHFAYFWCRAYKDP